MKDLLYIRPTNDILLIDRLKKPSHGQLNILNDIVNDIVVAYVHFFLGGNFGNPRICTHIKTNNDSTGSRSEHHIRFRYGACGGMDDFDFHLFCTQFQQGIGKGLYGTLHISLQNKVELLNLALFYPVKKIIKADDATPVPPSCSHFCLAHLNDLFGRLFIPDHNKFITRHRNSGNSIDLYRNRGTSRFHPPATMIEHGPELAVVLSTDKIVTLFERSTFDKNRSNRPPALVQLCLNDCTPRCFVWILFQFKDFRL